MYRLGRLGLVEDVGQQADTDYREHDHLPVDAGSDPHEEYPDKRWEWSDRESPNDGEPDEDAGSRSAWRPAAAASSAAAWWGKRPFGRPDTWGGRSQGREGADARRKEERGGDAAWLWGERGLLLLLRAFLSSFRSASREVTSAIWGALPPSVPRGLVTTAVGGVLALTALWLAQVLLQVAFSVGAAALVLVLIVRSFWVAGALMRAEAASPLGDDDGGQDRQEGGTPMGSALQGARSGERRMATVRRGRRVRPRFRGLEGLFPGGEGPVQADVRAVYGHSSASPPDAARSARNRRRGYEPSDSFELEEWRWSGSAAAWRGGTA